MNRENITLKQQVFTQREVPGKFLARYQTLSQPNPTPLTNPEHMCCLHKSLQEDVVIRHGSDFHRVDQVRQRKGPVSAPHQTNAAAFAYAHAPLLLIHIFLYINISYYATAAPSPVFILHPRKDPVFWKHRNSQDINMIWEGTHNIQTEILQTVRQGNKPTNRIIVLSVRYYQVELLRGYLREVVICDIVKIMFITFLISLLRIKK